MGYRPEGFATLTPFLVVSNAAAAIDLYKAALNARELGRIPIPGAGKIAHATLKIGDSIMFMCDEAPAQGMLAPKGGQTGPRFYVYVEDVDAAHAHAVANGLKELSRPSDMSWGDRAGVLTDPYGQIWTLATHQREVAPDEIEKAMAAMG